MSIDIDSEQGVCSVEIEGSRHRAPVDSLRTRRRISSAGTLAFSSGTSIWPKARSHIARQTSILFL